MDPTVVAAAIGVGGTVIVGVAGYVASVRNATKGTALTLRALELTEQGQVAARYTNAIGQLGSDMPDVRIGGIYALERIARDSPRDHPTVMEVLASFIRARSEWLRQEVSDALARGGDLRRPFLMTGRDIQAAITVIGRREVSRDKGRVDLAGAYLNRMSLAAARLADATLADADLTSADLTGAQLTGAQLTGANLSAADLFGADLTNANLTSANLSDARLMSADLDGANLTSTDLTRADLTRADLTGANVFDADLTSTNLTGANLTNTLWPQKAAVPGGWQRRPDSSRLARAGTDSGPAAPAST